MTHTNLAAYIPVKSIVLDPDGDDVFYRIVDVEHGTATLSADGGKVFVGAGSGFGGGGRCRWWRTTVSTVPTWYTSVLKFPMLRS